jgi:hypothetical protein
LSASTIIASPMRRFSAERSAKILVMALDRDSSFVSAGRRLRLAAMMILGFAGIGFMAYRRSRKSTMALTAACANVKRRWSESSLPRSQVSDLYSSLGSFLACLMSADTTDRVSLLATFASIT